MAEATEESMMTAKRLRETFRKLRRRFLRAREAADTGDIVQCIELNEQNKDVIPGYGDCQFEAVDRAVCVVCARARSTYVC